MGFAMMMGSGSSLGTEFAKVRFANHRIGAAIYRGGLTHSTASGRGCTLSVRCSSSPSAIIMDGKAEAKKITDDITIQVSRMKESIGVVPGLAVILVGDNQESATYVRNSKKACKSAGIQLFQVCLPEDSSEEQVLESISGFNNDPCVHGIIVQLPLPSHMDEGKISKAVMIEKDVDGFHPLPIGELGWGDEIEHFFVPCTPKGCMKLLHSYNIEIHGKDAVVIVRSKTDRMPASFLLLQDEDAFGVRTIHSKTKNPEEISRQADIIISAAGQPNLVRGSWIKPGAVVIDVGTKRVEDSSAPSGFRYVGDVCYEEARKVASYITPVPGGVGPMTVAMLLMNTLEAAKRSFLK